MGACSSRPRVLEDEARMPRQPDVDHRTSEETTVMEAAPVMDKPVLETEEVFVESEAVDDQEVLQLVVEKHVVEAEAITAAAEEGPTETNDSNKVQEVPDVGESNQEETPATDDVSDNVESVAEPEETYNTLLSKEAAQDSAVPETEGKSSNSSESPAQDVQEVSVSSEPESEKKTDSFESGAQAPPAEASQEGSGSAPAQPPSAAAGNPFQALISNVTRGWGWH